MVYANRQVWCEQGSLSRDQVSRAYLGLQSLLRRHVLSRRRVWKHLNLKTRHAVESEPDGSVFTAVKRSKPMLTSISLRLPPADPPPPSQLSESP
jgi:hypothetical protein